MPTKIEKDAVSGQETTGHEWDGIKELNTPLPRWWLYTFYACVAFSMFYVILYPAIPGFSSHTTGVLGYNSRLDLEDNLAKARDRQAEYWDAIAAAELSEIPGDPDRLTFALTGGAAAFADNCAPCHGQGGAGRPGGYPVLADDAWIWGGTLDDIHTTLLHGIRNGDEDARESEMPAYGDILEPEQIEAVADYVLSLSGSEHDSTAAEAGQEIFAENCAACHGENGEGIRELGGPRLNDQVWLYGGSRDQVINQIRQPKLGVMPGWKERLDPSTIKMLTVYVHSLGGGEE